MSDSDGIRSGCVQSSTLPVQIGRWLLAVLLCSAGLMPGVALHAQETGNGAGTTPSQNGFPFPVPMPSPVAPATPVAPGNTPPGNPAPDTPPPETLAPETATTTTTTTLPAIETIQADIAVIEKDEGIDTAVKEQALQAYRAAVAGLQRRQNDLKDIEQSKKVSAERPDDAAKLESLLNSLPASHELTVTAQSSVKELEAAVALAEAALKESESSRTQFEQINTQLPIARKQLIDRQAIIPNRREELKASLAAAVDPTVSPLVAKATRLQQQVHLQVLTTEEEAIQQKLSLHDLEKSLRFNSLGLEYWTRKVALDRKHLETLQQMLTSRKREEARDQLAILREESSTTFPILQSYIDEIEVFTEQIGNLLDLTQQAQNDLSSVKLILEEVNGNKSDTEQKENTEAGKSEAFSLSLLRQLYALPDVESFRERIVLHNAEISEATYQQLELGSQKRRLINLEKVIDEAIEKIKKTLDTTDLGFLEQGLRSDLKKLIGKKRESIENLESASDNYLRVMTDLATTEANLIRTVDEYRDFIQQRIFWIRSEKVLGWKELGSLLQPENIPLSQGDLAEVVVAARAELGAYRMINLIGLGLLFVLVLLRVQAGREMTVLAEQARKVNRSNILPTLRAILLTLVIAAPGPLLIWFVGWRLESAPEGTPVSLAIARSLQLIGGVYGVLEFFRQLCRRHGVVDAHFNGPNVLSTRIRHDYFLMMTLLLPLFFVVSVFKELTNEQTRMPAERVLFCAGMIMASLFAYRILNPQGSLMREFFANRQAASISRIRWIWYPLATVTPLLLAIMAWVGYYYTATQLGWKVLLTWLLLGSILFVWGLALRWYRMAQRWFRIYVLRERLRQPAEETQTLDGQRLKLERDVQINDKDREKQTLKLINYGILVPLLLGLWMIWIDVLPAVAYLDELPLWYTQVQGEVVGTDDVPVMRLVREAITPLDLSVALLAAVITIFLSRNLPGMLDFALLQRIGIDASLRYAITSVIGYLITFIGVTYGFTKLGFRWEQIQWLAAALTFGLSFGLQEIFANFISGLIILFERPIRIGDIVTIEGVTGVVSKIRIRASTITDWDRKEFLVPNKELVTGRVLNWTLTDTMNRLVIPVGVAYGSDTDRVREILFEIIRNESELLPEPPPLVTFEEFGNSTLNFVIRVYLASLDKRLETIHRLHTLIHRRFIEEGIEIAFPQQDLHIRSIPETWRVMMPHQEKAAPPAPDAADPARQAGG